LWRNDKGLAAVAMAVAGDAVQKISGLQVDDPGQNPDHPALRVPDRPK
jgi:hypothetical protein